MVSTETRLPRLKRGLVEFLAIFLGVSMGFVAEDWRESLAEAREVELVMEGLVSDLNQDLAAVEAKAEVDGAGCSHKTADGCSDDSVDIESAAISR